VTLKCRLCQSKSVDEFLEVERPFKAKYYICSNCDLVFLDETQLLESKEERSQYSLHQNDKRDPGYVNFLFRSIGPTLRHIKPNFKGLDFGCGPYPMLVELMKEEGFDMDFYDPYFFPSQNLDKEYDFVISTEVVEHFNNPNKSWAELVSKVAEGGILSIMTSIRYQDIDFKSWHYRNDQTHISFYSEKTLEWIATHFNLELIDKEKNVAIFKKL
tara:strand:+ start:849 stop:1493 length:645 start_codon:yes stop_codon:yes gene_type:complete